MKKNQTESFIPLFSYGTLQLIEIQKLFFKREPLIAKGILENHRTVFRGDYLNICISPGENVVGQVLWLNKKEWEICDLWEEYPALYLKKEVIINLKDSPEKLLKASCYHCENQATGRVQEPNTDRLSLLSDTELMETARIFIKQIPQELKE